MASTLLSRLNPHERFSTARPRQQNHSKIEDIARAASGCETEPLLNQRSNRCLANEVYKLRFLSRPADSHSQQFIIFN